MMLRRCWLRTSAPKAPFGQCTGVNVRRPPLLVRRVCPTTHLPTLRLGAPGYGIQVYFASMSSADFLVQK
jgi:hypothetical protein